MAVKIQMRLEIICNTSQTLNIYSKVVFNSPISTPRVYGVNFLKMIELVGLFPWNTWAEDE